MHHVIPRRNVEAPKGVHHRIFVGDALEIGSVVGEEHVDDGACDKHEDGGDEDEAIAALLHDAVEDQGGDAARQEIRRRFGERVVAIKNVTMNEPQFTGHWPENPVMPGVLILEALAQLGDHQWKDPPGGFLNIKKLLDNPGDIVIRLDNVDALEGERTKENAEKVLKDIFGEKYVPQMKPTPLLKRLARMKREMEQGEESLERKLRYLLWLN